MGKVARALGLSASTVSLQRLAAHLPPALVCPYRQEGLFTAGCIDTDLPAGRRYSSQSGKPLIQIAHVHHAVWVTFIETRCDTLTGETYPSQCLLL
jgi:hypothetical protein